VRRHAAVVVGIWAVLTVAALALTVNTSLLPAVASREGEVADRAFVALLLASLPVFFLVHVVVVYSGWRFRADPTDGDGPPIRSNGKLEAVWVGVTFAMVLGLSGYGWIGMVEMRTHEHTDLRVLVVGSQFAWRFEYPDLRIRSTELRLPKDARVRLEITSTDVLHSFWVPAFRVKQDAVPGRTVTLVVTPTEAGRYDSPCAELCGVGHTIMHAPVEVMEPAAFQEWAATQRAAAAP
jgi:cytochrome c oxidase subunit II